MNGFYLNENNESIYVGILISLLQLSTWSVFRYYKRYKAMEEAYWGERRGRTRVEQEMRNLAQVQLNTSEGFFVQPIGRIESCYKQCIGYSYFILTPFLFLFYFVHNLISLLQEHHVKDNLYLQVDQLLI